MRKEVLDEGFTCKAVYLFVSFPSGSSGVPCGSCSRHSSEATPYFQGKQIEIIAATAAGGGPTPRRASLPRFCPSTYGKPTIIVRNQPGAGGAVAANSFYERAKPDGLTLFHGSAT